MSKYNLKIIHLLKCHVVCVCRCVFFLRVWKQQGFPKKLPMSQSVPQIYSQVKEFIYASLKFSESLHRRLVSLAKRGYFTCSHDFYVMSTSMSRPSFVQLDGDRRHAEEVNQPAADENPEQLPSEPHQEAPHRADWGGRGTTSRRTGASVAPRSLRRRVFPPLSCSWCRSSLTPPTWSRRVGIWRSSSRTSPTCRLKRCTPPGSTACPHSRYQLYWSLTVGFFISYWSSPRVDIIIDGWLPLGSILRLAALSFLKHPNVDLNLSCHVELLLHFIYMFQLKASRLEYQDVEMLVCVKIYVSNWVKFRNNLKSDFIRPLSTRSTKSAT